MTSHRQRIEACVNGRIVDRPPVALWRHFPVDDQEPRALAEAHLEFQARYDFDLVKITPASSYSVRDWGVEDAWEGSTEGTRRYTKRVIHKASDWKQLKVLEPDSGHLGEQLECIRIIRERITPDTPILQTVFNPLSQAKHLAGEDTLKAHLREQPEAVGAGLAVITESTRRFIEAAARLGVDGIFYAVQHAQEGLMAEVDFTRWSRDSDMQLLQCGRNLWCNMLHVHGDHIYFESFRDYPAPIINWHDRETGPSLSAAANLWHGAMCGGLSRKTLVFGTPKELAQEAADAMEASTPRSVILSTGCVVPIIAPHGNLIAARRAVEPTPRRGPGGPRTP